MNGLRFFKITSDYGIFFVFAYSEMEAEHLVLNEKFAHYTKQQIKELHFDIEEIGIKAGIADITSI